jgi:hypothetical protein
MAVRGAPHARTEYPVPSPPRAFVEAGAAGVPRRDSAEHQPSASTKPVEPSRLGAELDSVDHARAALGGGNARQALRELASYERSYPKGQLGLEVEMLRMEAYALLGDKPRARALAAHILSAPVSPLHAARAREIYNDGSEP